MTETVYLVHSGDKYSWVWPYWYYWWSKYWGNSEYMDTVFVTEEKPIDYPGIIQVQSGPGPWADQIGRVLKALKCKYVIYQHEDYFLEEPTAPWLPDIKALVSLMNEHDMKLMKCCGMWAGFTDDKAPMYESGITVNIRGKDEPIWKYPNESRYLVSHQTAIWDREFLFSTLYTGESPWAHEIVGTHRLRDRKPMVPIYAYRGKCPIPYGETVTHGKIRAGCEHWFDEPQKEAENAE